MVVGLNLGLEGSAFMMSCRGKAILGLARPEGSKDQAAVSYWNPRPKGCGARARPHGFFSGTRVRPSLGRRMVTRRFSPPPQLFLIGQIGFLTPCFFFPLLLACLWESVSRSGALGCGERTIFSGWNTR